MRLAGVCGFGKPNGGTPASSIPLDAPGWDSRAMSRRTTPQSAPLTALELRGHVLQLEAERSLALRSGLGGVSAYMADLDEELDHRRHLYVAAAVTEIARLRAELSGPQDG